MGLRSAIRLLTSPLFVRVWAAGSAFLAALALASLIGPDAYGPLALALFVAKVSPVLTGGASYGFIKKRLSGGKDMPAVLGFLSIYQFHLAAGILLLSAMLDAELAWLALALLPVVAVEPIEKLQERLHYAFLPDLVCFSSGLLAYLSLGVVSVRSVAPFALGLSAVVYLHSLVRRRRQGGDSGGRRLRPRAYFDLMRNGASLQLATVLVASLMMLDRFFLATYWGASLLGIFMLAYQLAQAATFPAQSLIQLYLLRYPQLLARGLAGLAAVANLLRENRLFATLAVAAPFVAIAASLVYAQMFREFSELPLFAILLTSGAVVWTFCNAHLPRLFFSNRMNLLVGPMALLILVDLAAHLTVLRLGQDLLFVPAIQLLMFCWILYRVHHLIGTLALEDRIA